MLTKTIGQLSASTTLLTADYLEIEQSGASKRTSIGSAGTLIANTERPYATSAESAAGSSTTAVITPSTLRAGINAENEAPIYACRAWANFDGTTVSSSITGTYTRASGSTTVVVTATSHGCITGNYQYLDFTSGTASDNSYLVTVVDENTFNVTGTGTAATSGNVTIKRIVINASGNINNISYNAVGDYLVNFAVSLPDAYYSMCGMQTGATTANGGQNIYICGVTATGATLKTQYCVRIQTYVNTTGLADFKEANVAFFR